MPGKADTLKVVCVGDIYPKSHAVFDPTRSILKGADITFGQLEAILSNRGTPQVAEFPPELNRSSGDCPPKLPPHAIGDLDEASQILADAGLNIMSFASNHSYNRSEEGIIDTIAALKSQNIVCIGAGRNIDEATRPAIFNKNGNKIGFLAYCSVVPRGSWATSGKAGVAPLRASTAYEQIDWQPGRPPRVISWCDKDDIAGMIGDIEKLRPQVDILVVSMHWGVHFVPGLIADYQFEAGHAAIDAGADLIIGHHPHILKGIELYKGKAIFYSLGNFSFYSLAAIPAIKASGLYWLERFGTPIQVDMEHPNYPYPVDSQKTMLVKCDIIGKKLQRVAYLPLWMNVQNQPEIVPRTDKRSEEHLLYMQWLCGNQRLDTGLTCDGDEVVLLP